MPKTAKSVITWYTLWPRLVSKLEAHGITGNVLRWVEDWLHWRKQSSNQWSQKKRGPTRICTGSSSACVH